MQVEFTAEVLTGCFVKIDLLRAKFAFPAAWSTCQVLQRTNQALSSIFYHHRGETR